VETERGEDNETIVFETYEGLEEWLQKYLETE